MAPAADSSTAQPDEEASFPCALAIDIPFPSPRLAAVALQVLQVDQELSPLVRRRLALVVDEENAALKPSPRTGGVLFDSAATDSTAARTLRVTYCASTNRMLRVAVNGFWESLGVVLATMRELDVDVAGAAWVGDDFVPADGLGAGGATAGAELKEEVDTLGRVQGLSEVGAL